MKYCWWIIRDWEGLLQVIHAGVKTGKVPGTIIGPYWSQEEAKKIIALWK